MEDEVLKVEGMHCSACEQALEAALSKLDGVTSATADREAGTVEVTYDAELIDHDAFVKAIEDEGFFVVA